MKRIVSIFLFATTFTCSGETLQIEVATKPNGKWTSYPTTTVEQLPAEIKSKVDPELSKYGGILGRKEKATGFFHTAKIEGRWWLVDPDGCLFIHKGVTSVGPLHTTGAEAALKQKFGDAKTWAEKTSEMLLENSFNGMGGWADTKYMESTPKRLVTTRIWNFMSSYGKKRGGTVQQPGHTGYPGDCIFVFDPEFETFCDEHAKALEACKDDPWILGHFSDNEMPLKKEALQNYLKLPENDHGHKAALEWLKKKHGAHATAKDITDKDREAFLAHVVDRYYSIVSKAIKKHDPNHLYLGSRLHGGDLSKPEIFHAVGPYADVVSVNYYHAWTASPEKMAMWEKEAGKPFIITEWYAKGMDSGMGNTSGAGWVVKTQADRGRFYENFTLSLLQNKGCVGWHWFKYADNDPTDTKADPSNTDSNKGVVNARYEPYKTLLDSMKRVNERAYVLIDYFDKK